MENILITTENGIPKNILMWYKYTSNCHKLSSKAIDNLLYYIGIE